MYDIKKGTHDMRSLRRSFEIEDGDNDQNRGIQQGIKKFVSDRAAPLMQSVDVETDGTVVRSFTFVVKEKSGMIAMEIIFQPIMFYL